MNIKKFLIIISISLFVFIGKVFAQLTPLVQNQINNDQGQISALNDAIANDNSQISFYQGDIANKQAQIINLESNSNTYSSELPQVQAFDTQLNAIQPNQTN